MGAFYNRYLGGWVGRPEPTEEQIAEQRQRALAALDAQKAIEAERARPLNERIAGLVGGIVATLPADLAAALRTATAEHERLRAELAAAQQELAALTAAEPDDSADLDDWTRQQWVLERRIPALQKMATAAGERMSAAQEAARRALRPEVQKLLDAADAAYKRVIEENRDRLAAAQREMLVARNVAGRVDSLRAENLP